MALLFKGLGKSWGLSWGTDESTPPTAVVHEGGAVLKSTAWDSLHMTKEQLLHRDRLMAEDILATEFILALLSNSEIIHG